MAKVLKITKADKTVHIGPLSNKASLLAYNKRLKADQQMKIEEIEEEEAKDIAYIDESYVTAGEAVAKVADLEAKSAADKARIAELEAQLAKLNGGGAPPVSAEDKISQIKAAETVEQVNEILGDDTRKTVQAAANKRIAELEA